MAVFVCQEYRYPQGARTVYMFYGCDDEIDPNYLLKMYSRQHETEGMRFIVGFMDII